MGRRALHTRPGCAATGTSGGDKLDAANLLSGNYEFDSYVADEQSIRKQCDVYCLANPTGPNRLSRLRSGSPIYQVTSSVSPVYSSRPKMTRLLRLSLMTW